MPGPIQPGAVYTIRNVKGGTVLDLSSGDSRSVIGWEYLGGENQKWIVEPHNHQGEFGIRNLKMGKYLAIEGGEKSGTKVVAVDHPTDDAWVIHPSGPFHKIQYKGTHFVLDLAGGSPENNTKVFIWEANHEENQLWDFTQV